MRSLSIFMLITSKEVYLIAYSQFHHHTCKSHTGIHFIRHQHKGSYPENVVPLINDQAPTTCQATGMQRKLPLSAKGSEFNVSLIHSFLQVSANRKMRQTCPIQINLPSHKDQWYKLRAQVLLPLVATKLLRPHTLYLAPVLQSAGHSITSAKAPHAFKHQ